jgi:cytochrome c
MRGLALAALLLLAPLSARALPPGDAARGEKVAQRCLACHAVDRDRTGPHHAGLVGRRAGSVDGFAYSAAMKKAGAGGLVWTRETLDRFLANPTRVVPGTRMGYAGVKDEQERADLIAYLERLSPATAAR